MSRTPTSTRQEQPFTNGGIRIVQQATVGLDDIAVAIGDWQGATATLPLFREEHAKTVTKQPVKLLAPTGRHSKQDQFCHAGRKPLGIGKGQRAAP